MMKRRELRIGDMVSYNHGPRKTSAKVVEDRGHTGVGGRQIVVIEVLYSVEAGEPVRFEMPAAELRVEGRAA